jgi:hypothetical protein
MSALRPIAAIPEEWAKMSAIEPEADIRHYQQLAFLLVVFLFIR